MYPVYDGRPVAMTDYHCPGGLSFIAHNHDDNGCGITTYVRRDLADAVVAEVERLGGNIATYGPLGEAVRRYRDNISPEVGSRGGR